MRDIRSAVMRSPRFLRAGDHIRKRRGLYDHHGIYIGNGWVIHFWGVRPDKVEGSIRLGTLRAFAGSDGRFEIVEYGRCFHPDDVVRRAYSRLGQGGYNAVFRNCEHFARWCKTGEHASAQVERVATSAAATAGTSGAASFGIGAVASGGLVYGMSGPGIMSGLAALGGSATAGIGVAAAMPATVATIATHRLLRDDPCLPRHERAARRAGRRASTVGAVAGTGASLALVSAAGLPGLSAAGITSGLATIGGTMVGGLLVASLLPAAAAVVVGLAVHRRASRQRHARV
jgi:hypothetical protein